MSYDPYKVNGWMWCRCLELPCRLGRMACSFEVGAFSGRGELDLTRRRSVGFSFVQLRRRIPTSDCGSKIASRYVTSSLYTSSSSLTHSPYEPHRPLKHPPLLLPLQNPQPPLRKLRPTMPNPLHPYNLQLPLPSLVPHLSNPRLTLFRQTIQLRQHEQNTRSSVQALPRRR